MKNVITFNSKISKLPHFNYVGCQSGIKLKNNVTPELIVNVDLEAATVSFRIALLKEGTPERYENFEIGEESVSLNDFLKSPVDLASFIQARAETPADAEGLEKAMILLVTQMIRPQAQLEIDYDSTRHDSEVEFVLRNEDGILGETKVSLKKVTNFFKTKHNSTEDDNTVDDLLDKPRRTKRPTTTAVQKQ